LIDNMTQAQLIRDGLDFDCDGDSQTGVDGKECHVPWITPDILTPITLAGFSAASSDAGVQLTWSLDPGALSNIRSIQVQRAMHVAGPYENVGAPQTQVSSDMSFVDTTVDAGSTTWYRLQVHLQDGSVDVTRSIQIESGAMPSRSAELHVVSTADAVEIHYSLAATSGSARLQVIDVRGRLVADLNDGPRTAGRHVRLWNGLDQSGRPAVRGIYFARLIASGTHLTHKFLLLRD
jgi:hypothetical protein